VSRADFSNAISAPQIRLAQNLNTSVYNFNANNVARMGEKVKKQNNKVRSPINIYFQSFETREKTSKQVGYTHLITGAPFENTTVELVAYSRWKKWHRFRLPIFLWNVCNRGCRVEALQAQSYG